MGWIVTIKLKGKFEIGQFGLGNNEKDKLCAIEDFENELDKFLRNLGSYASLETDGEIEAKWENEE